MLDRQKSEKFDMLAPHRIAIVIVSLLVIYDYYHTETPIVVRIKNPKFTLLEPYNTSEPILNEDVYDQLIDLKNFTFKVNPQPCQEYTSGLLLVVIVSSNPHNFKNRMAIRNTWGRSVDSMKVVFLMGEVENITTSSRIEDESLEYGDIVLGSFADAYRNMSYKHVMGLKWVTHYCSTAKYTLKTDDDVVVNSHALRQFLSRELSPWGAKNLITCQVLEHAAVQRSQRSKWKVSPAEYEQHYYPTYCAGWAILYSRDVVPRLLKAAQLTSYFWIDDVLITGIVAQKIGVPRTPLASLVLTWNRAKLLTSVGPHYAGQFLLGPPDISVDKMIQIWKAIPE